MESTLGLGSVITLWYKNPQRKLLGWLSVFVIAIFASKILFYQKEYWGVIASIIAAAGLILIYSLRFQSKRPKKFIDYLKFLGVGLLMLYPLTSYYFRIFESNLLFILSYITIPILGTIYIYDRWILKLENMKKKYIVVLAVQSLVVLLMFIYALAQREKAIRMAQDAAEYQKLAKEINDKYQQLLLKENNP